ncbi:MAG: hypothetical protein CMK07_10655 [Ponticaulis sp.]|nr:hypothetical protein [Ponticaulis sp.]
MALAAPLMLVACTAAGLPKVHKWPEPFPGAPALLEPVGSMSAVSTTAQWQTERAPYFRELLLNEIYGSIPPATPFKPVSRKVLSEDILGGEASLIAVRMILNIQDESYLQDLHIVVPNTEGPHPLILGAGSCPNDVTLPYEEIVRPRHVIYPDYCNASGVTEGLSKFVFGRYIETPPIKRLIREGFAYGAYYPGMVIPDEDEAGVERLATINRNPGPNGPYGAVGVWAWTASRLADYLETEPAIDPERIILFGHSRMAKSSLLAAALDDRFAGVMTHQSGTAGASLQRNEVGESIAEITERYPHWFSPRYAEYANNDVSVPVDQHALIALVAPRPVFLGNAEHDQWSDPQGAFSAAQAASPVYQLYGEEPFTARTLRDFQPEAPIAYQFRNGTHGITPEDWRAMRKWLAAHFAE